MRYRTQCKSALETRVDYVESRLDDTIKDFKEAMQQAVIGILLTNGFQV